MTRKFKIGGISCPKCVDKIIYNLKRHPDVKDTTIHIEQKIVEVDLRRDLPVQELQKTISPNNIYFIRQEITDNHNVSTTSDTPFILLDKVKKLFTRMAKIAPPVKKKHIYNFYFL